MVVIKIAEIIRYVHTKCWIITVISLIVAHLAPPVGGGHHVAVSTRTWFPRASRY